MRTITHSTEIKDKHIFQSMCKARIIPKSVPYDLLILNLKSLKIFLSIACGTLLGMLLVTPAQAQVSKKPIHFDLKLMNIRYWRGNIESNQPSTIMQFFIPFKDSGFKAGIWSAYSLDLDKENTEINYIVGYSRSGFALNIVVIPNSYDIFDSHTDYKTLINISYILQNKRFPLKIFFSPMISGKDDTYTDKKGKKKKRYSNYLELSMPVLLKDEKPSLILGAGGGFSFVDESNYYGEHANFTNLFIEYRNSIKLLKYSVPLSIKSFWNPEKHYGGVQVSFKCF